MPIKEFNGEFFPVNEDGFLEILDLWCEEFVLWVAQQEGFGELTEEHWKVIKFIHNFYKGNGTIPMVFILARGTKMSQNKLYELFADGLKVALRMAGVERIVGCY